jgi:hypothetical protein
VQIHRRTHGNGEVEHDLTAEHLFQSLVSGSRLPKTLNGNTYASNRFEGHCEVGLRGVESFAAGVRVAVAGERRLAVVKSEWCEFQLSSILAVHEPHWGTATQRLPSPRR